MGQKGGYELPLTDMAAALALAITGPGRYSLDRILGLRLRRSLVGLTVLGAAALSAYSASRVVEHKRASGPEPAPEELAEEVPDPAAR